MLFMKIVKSSVYRVWRQRRETLKLRGEVCGARLHAGVGVVLSLIRF